MRYNAASAPSGSSNLAAGYRIGDQWKDSSTGYLWRFAAETSGTATWEVIDTAAGPPVNPARVTGPTDGGPINFADLAGTASSAQLAADCVTGAKIADDAVDSEHIAAGAIDTEHIGAAQVTVAKLAAGRVWSYRAGDPASAAQQVTASQAAITGTSVTLPALNAGDRIEAMAVVEVVANGDVEDLDFVLQIGGVDIATLATVTAVGVYRLACDVVVDVDDASGTLTGYNISGAAVVNATVDTTGPPAVQCTIQSSATAATVRVRSINVIHCQA
jgi:hypothetical protein